MKKVLVLLVGLIGLTSCSQQEVDPLVGTYEGTYELIINGNNGVGTIIDTSYDITVQVFKTSGGNYYFDFPHQPELIYTSGDNVNTFQNNGMTIFDQYLIQESGEVDYIYNIEGWNSWTPIDTVTIPTYINTKVKFEGYKIY